MNRCHTNRCLTAATCLLLLSCVTAYGAGQRRSPSFQRQSVDRRTDLRIGAASPVADTCFVSPNKTIVYRIDGWVTGGEWYKAIMDPAQNCTGAYPYQVSAINMPMYFADSVTFVASVDIESIDSTTVPGCTAPGALKTSSSDYTIRVPKGGGTFNLWIPLDTPMVVNNRFFAGFFLSTVLDTLAGAAVLVDTFPAFCATWNLWDTTIGFVDLCNNQIFKFPGRLAMEVSGIPSACCLGSTGNVDCDQGHGVDISDVTAIIDHLFVNLTPLCCPRAANVDGSIGGNVDISDVTALIDYLFINFNPPAACQ